MPFFKTRLADISTRSELADKIGVDVKAFDYIKLSTTTCINEDCNLLAVLKNNGRCLLCSQSWYPRKLKSNGVPLKKPQRGHGLHGLQFMYDYGRSKPTTCCCDNPLCEEIGYPREYD